MGTNYYAKEAGGQCPHCGHGKADLHLGKASVGWCFSLHVYPDRGITNLLALMDKIRSHKIVDESGREISRKEFYSRVKDRQGNIDFSQPPRGSISSWQDFHRINNSEPGPNNLLRHKISHYCIDHGEGTWDYIIGDFS